MRPLSPPDLLQVAQIHFPLCMRHLDEHLRDDHHLKFHGRWQYGLFIKVPPGRTPAPLCSRYSRAPVQPVPLCLCAPVPPVPLCPCTSMRGVLDTPRRQSNEAPVHLGLVGNTDPLNIGAGEQ